MAEDLSAVVAGLDGIGAFDAVAPLGLADDEVVAATVLAETLGRVADAARVRFAELIAERSVPERGDARLTVRQGVSTVPMLVARLTGVSIHSAQWRVKLAAAQSTISLGGTSNESVEMLALVICLLIHAPGHSGCSTVSPNRSSHQTERNKFLLDDRADVGRIFRREVHRVVLRRQGSGEGRAHAIRAAER